MKIKTKDRILVTLDNKKTVTGNNNKKQKTTTTTTTKTNKTKNNKQVTGNIARSTDHKEQLKNISYRDQ